MRAMQRGDILEIDCESTQSLYEQLAEIEMEHVPNILEEQVVNELNEQVACSLLTSDMGSQLHMFIARILITVFASWHI